MLSLRGHLQSTGRRMSVVVREALELYLGSGGQEERLDAFEKRLKRMEEVAGI